MKIAKSKIVKIARKVSRQIEIESGRTSFNRVHKNKKVYSRKVKWSESED